MLLKVRRMTSLSIMLSKNFRQLRLGCKQNVERLMPSAEILVMCWTEKYFFSLHFGKPTFGDHALSVQ